MSDYNNDSINSSLTNNPAYLMESMKLSPYQIISIFIGSSAIILNLLVIIVFKRATPQNTIGWIPRLFILNQSSIDAIAGGFLIVAQFHGISLGYNIGPPELFLSAEMYCKIIWSTYSMWAMLSSSTFNLLMLTLERYVSICHSAFHRKHATKTLIHMIMAFTWIVGPSAVIWVVVDYKYNPDTGICVLIQDKVRGTGFGTFNFLWFCIIPSVTIILCYAKIIIVLKARASKRGDVGGSSGSAPSASAVAPASTIGRSGSPVPVQPQAVGSATSQNQPKKKHNVLFTMFLVAMAYLVCYGPNQVFWYAYQMGVEVDLQSSFFSFTVFMVNINCCINPILYAFKMEAFRDGFRKLLTINTNG